MKRKILYSPGYGAGWTTWNDPKVNKIILTYQPIIDFLESGGKFTDKEVHDNHDDPTKGHPILVQLQKVVKDKLGENQYCCVLGADDLEVYETSGRVRIEEYDGSESVEEEGAYDEWL